jgi:ABC-2 type transport system ATP-binding protein
MRSRVLAAAVAAAAALTPLLVASPAVHAETPAFVEIPVHIPASTPDDEGNPVVLDGGVDVPTSGCPCPLILVNHGFLGNWHDSGDVASSFASHGYVVVRYSSRGFGNTPGEVDLVGPKETQDMADAITYVQDNLGHIPQLDGTVIKNDAGQYGGSYGGGHAWAAAMSTNTVLRAAIKATVPTATWSDFYQALLPNDVMLAAYANGFYATGYDPTASEVNDLTGSSTPKPGAPDMTQNYSKELHVWMAEANSGVQADATPAGIPDIKTGLDARSVMYHLADVHAPVFIVQGSNDGLFTENQALTAYLALRRLGKPARLYIGGIGHPPSNGSTSSPEALHIGAEMLAWFDHYLKGVDNGIDRMPPVEFSHTTYFNNSWDGTTRSARTFPAGPTQRFFLCATGPTGGTLSTTSCASANPLVATNLPAGSGYDQEPVTRKYVQQGIHELTCQSGEPICQQSDPNLDSYPEVLRFDSAPVTADTEWFGPPRLALQVGSVDVLPTGARGALAAFQLDPKFYDVAPDGSATLITRGAYAQPLQGDAPSAATIPAHPVSYDAFGLSYLLPKGHALRLTLSTADVPYLRPTVNPFAVAVFAGSALDLPAATDAFATPSLDQPPASLPEARVPAVLALAGLVVITALALSRRRRHTAAG